ncbi:MAG: enoyl-CoA hydratase/isomerase family protein, partial [Candidatus Binatia bacterium]
MRRKTTRIVSTPEPDIRFSLRGHVGRIVIAGSRAGNRFTPAMAVAFAEACERCEDEACHVVLLTAEGNDFCRGIEGNLADWPPISGADFVAALARVTRPVVAALRGRVEAEGFELALAADLRLVAPRTRLSLPQVARGALPRFGGTQRLPRMVGAERALRLILLGEEMRGSEAVDLGLAMAASSRPELVASRLAGT